MSRTYATEPEYAAWLGIAEAPKGAAHLLRDASLDVDEMLIGAIYQVDHDDKPTDPKVIEVLRDATCAQAQHRYEHGDDIDMLTSGEAVRLGPLSLGGASSTSKSTPIPTKSPKAFRILRLAGLITNQVQDA